MGLPKKLFKDDNVENNEKPYFAPPSMFLLVHKRSEAFDEERTK